MNRQIQTKKLTGRQRDKEWDKRPIYTFKGQRDNTKKQKNMQTDGHTYRQTDKETHKETDKEIEGEKVHQTDRQIEICKQIDTDVGTDRQVQL